MICLFELKMKARKLLGDRYLKLWLYRFLSLLYLGFSFFLLSGPVFSSFFAEEYRKTEAEIILDCAFVFGALLFFVFSFLMKLYYKARLFYETDKSCLPPSAFFSFSMTVRFMMLRFLTAVKKLFYAAVFFAPFLSVLLILLTGFQLSGSMLKGVFYCLISLEITLFILGGAFYFTLCGRYFICDYLFYLNPRMPVTGIVKTASSLLRGKLISTALFRVSLLPWKLLSFLVITLPFSSAYTEAQKACKAQEIYSDREYYRNFNRLFKGIGLLAVKKMREADTGILPPL